MTEPRREQIRTRLFGSVACLCLAVQPLVVPLHLALETHISYPRDAIVEVEAHSDSARPHDDHDHGHDHHHDSSQSPQHESSNPHHPAHPAADHAGDLAKPAISPAPVVLVALALLPASPDFWDLPAVSRALVPSDSHDPPRPPPKRVASPRAPPAVA